MKDFVNFLSREDEEGIGVAEDAGAADDLLK